MYDVFNSLSQMLSGPLTTLAYQTNSIPLLSAFILGVLGATAPCQFTGNIGAITFYGNRSFQKGIVWSEVVCFILGKIVVFSTLGLIVWILGQEFQQSLTKILPVARKFFGPLVVLIGLYLLGVFKMNWSVKLGEVPERFLKKGKWGAFLMGGSFSLGFCPTMFSLFFILLMPLTLASPYGAVLPATFAIGTSLPFITAMFLIWYFGLSGAFLKKGRKVGSVLQKIAGIILVTIGIIDAITYWF
ncbi:sulfite exporter TauE/SafE family protein [Alkalihalobacillus macyae]|uniref:urease accessory protein UreH domain-containing protein n=1 Tax=Guptibacillus hwajinpoensis TaxID=208199 RepID=UPI00273B3BF4|nr:sulfite exporter TauE/SafE family protein [Alkalihalobacillus macyae]MDP4551920.1 sulfite exporter TauE/SafE family protein [Alkalihalobacillus macyae]